MHILSFPCDLYTSSKRHFLSLSLLKKVLSSFFGIRPRTRYECPLSSSFLFFFQQQQWVMTEYMKWTEVMRQKQCFLGGSWLLKAYWWLLTFSLHVSKLDLYFLHLYCISGKKIRYVEGQICVILHAHL